MLNEVLYFLILTPCLQLRLFPSFQAVPALPACAANPVSPTAKNINNAKITSRTCSKKESYLI